MVEEALAHDLPHLTGADDPDIHVPSPVCRAVPASSALTQVSAPLVPRVDGPVLRTGRPGWPSITHRAGALAGSVPLALCLVTAACGSAREDVPLSRFEESALVVGRVVENRTDCVVDANCALTIAFSDTTISALYGTGERPAPPCEIESAVADDAFEVEPGDVVRAIIARCGDDGYFIRRIEMDTTSAR